jgi:hypothetical protein
LSPIAILEGFYINFNMQQQYKGIAMENPTNSKISGDTS